MKIDILLFQSLNKCDTRFLLYSILIDRHEEGGWANPLVAKLYRASVRRCAYVIMKFPCEPESHFQTVVGCAL